MIIEKIDIPGIAVLEPEDDAPVGANRHCPKALQIAFQRVELQSGTVQVFDGSGAVEQRQDRADAFSISAGSFRPSSFSKNRFKLLCRKLSIIRHICNM